MTALTRESSEGSDGSSSTGGGGDKIFIPGLPRARNGGRRPARKKDLMRMLNVRVWVCVCAWGGEGADWAPGCICVCIYACVWGKKLAGLGGCFVCVCASPNSVSSSYPLPTTHPPHPHQTKQDDSDASSDGDGCYTSSSEDEFGGHGLVNGIVRIRCVGRKWCLCRGVLCGCLMHGRGGEAPLWFQDGFDSCPSEASNTQNMSDVECIYRLSETAAAPPHLSPTPTPTPASPTTPPQSPTPLSHTLYIYPQQQH